MAFRYIESAGLNFIPHMTVSLQGIKKKKKQPLKYILLEKWIQKKKIHRVRKWITQKASRSKKTPIDSQYNN